MKYFKIPAGYEPTVAEKALMLMVERGEAFPRTITVKNGEKLHFYKILTL